MNADGSDQRPMFSDAMNEQINIVYNFVDERTLSWGMKRQLNFRFLSASCADNLSGLVYSKKQLLR